MAKRDDGEVFTGSFDQLKDSAWLCSADLPWDRDTIVQIKEVRKHRNLTLRDETKNLAGSLHFVGKNKPLLLNAGHRSILKHLFGDAKGAQGGWVALYVDDNVAAFGQIVSAVRIRAKKVQMPVRGDPGSRPAPTNEAAELRAYLGDMSDVMLAMARRETGIDGDLASLPLEKLRALRDVVKE
jgi:hypothetical protein